MEPTNLSILSLLFPTITLPGSFKKSKWHVDSGTFTFLVAFFLDGFNVMTDSENVTPMKFHMESD